MNASPSELLAPRLEQRILPGLGRVRDALHALGYPQKRFASVLVVGTNGKGATAALLSSILIAHGVRTGLYTSPHLVDVEERIRVNGQMIEANALAERLLALAAFPELSYFETLTVAALQHFAAVGVEVAVLEAGLGGRWDAVNAVEPVLSLLSNVGTDHQAWLGPTRHHIAIEKASALRGREAIVGAWDAEVEPAIRAHAEAPLSEASDWAQVEIGVRGPGSGVRLLPPPRGFRPWPKGQAPGMACKPQDGRWDSWALEQHGPPGPRVSARVQAVAFEATLPLIGSHQLANLRLALAGAAALAKHGVTPPCEREALVRGIAGVRWPGRLQHVEYCGRHLLLDGAHNREAALALAGAVDELGLSGHMDLLFSCLQDKPLGEIAAILRPRVGKVTVVALASPRALPAAELAAAFSGAVLAEDVEAALHACDPARLTLVTGSLYLVGEVLRLLGGLDG